MSEDLKKAEEIVRKAFEQLEPKEQSKFVKDFEEWMAGREDSEHEA